MASKSLGLLVPLVSVLAAGCATQQGATQGQVAKAGGNSTIIDEGPASASGQGAGASSAGATAAAPAQLVPYQSSGGFAVLMPPNPQTQDKTEQTPGGPVNVHIAQAADPAGKPTFLATYSEFPPGTLEKVRQKELFDALQQSTVQSVGGTLKDSKDIQLSGLPGREFTATTQFGETVRTRMLLGPARVYTLAGTYAGEAEPPSVEQFLSSFTRGGPSGTNGTATGGSGLPAPAPSSATTPGPSSTGPATQASPGGR